MGERDGRKKYMQKCIRGNKISGNIKQECLQGKNILQERILYNMNTYIAIENFI
jgi:hypothetical protein